jgi:hypothetical protein
MREFKRIQAIWFRVSYRLRSLPSTESRLLRLGAITAIGAILLAPSIWMLSVVPPLWRDADAYIQVTGPPGPGTILHWGPLYCFVARIPLYLGYAVDSLRAGAPFPTPVFFLHPTLSNLGVFMLLLSQHVALWCSAFYFISVTSRLLLARFVLAVAWAANPLFYTFAHCVGTETLSVILLLLLAAMGLRIARHRRMVPRKEWVLFGVLLWLSALTRPINAMLAALIPLTFLLLSAYRLIAILLPRSRLLRRWQRIRAKLDLQKAAVAIAVGISCIILANASVRALCYAVRMPYHSTIGFAFLWRLKFLATIPPKTRNQLLDKVAKNAVSPDVQKAIRAMRESFSKAPNWDVKAFVTQAQKSVFPREAGWQEERYVLLLSGVMQAFLCPPKKVLLRAVAADFKRSRETSIASVVEQTFISTAMCFSQLTRMPAYASLYTFRDRTAAQIMTIFEKHCYIHRPKSFSYNVFLFFWFANFSLLALLAKMRKEQVAAVCSYAAALTLAGLVMMLANCFLAEFYPRYTLPMWELTILSLAVLFGKTIELCFPRTRISGRCSDHRFHLSLRQTNG